MTAHSYRSGKASTQPLSYADVGVISRLLQAYLIICPVCVWLNQKSTPTPFQMRGYATVMCAFCVGIVAVSTIVAPLAGPRTCSIKSVALPSSRFPPHTLQSIASRLTNTHQVLTQPSCSKKRRPFPFSLLFLLHRRYPQTSRASITTTPKRK